MDDLNRGAQSTQNEFEFYKMGKSRFSKVSFSTRKWRTSDLELVKLIHYYENREVVNIECQVNSKVPKYVYIINSCKNEKVLGLDWDHQRDVISLKISEIFMEAVNIIPNKRNILSIIASVYDPIGYLQLLVLMSKTLFQEICKLNMKKTVGKAYLNFYELQIILSVIELTINSRPFNKVHDNEMYEIMTPNYLLFR